MIKFVHVNIYQKLASKIAKRQANAKLVFCMKTTDNFV